MSILSLSILSLGSVLIIAGILWNRSRILTAAKQRIFEKQKKKQEEKQSKKAKKQSKQATGKIIEKEQEVSIQEIKKNISKAEILLSHNEEDEAEKILVSVLAIDANNIDAHIFLASLYLKRKQYSRAEVLYKELCELQDFKKAGSLSNLAFCFYEQNKLEDSIEAYSRALKIEPKNVKRYTNLGQVLFVTKQLDEAIDMFKKALKLNARDTEVLFMLADTYREKQDLKNAYKTYQKVLDYEPYNTIAREEVAKLEEADVNK